MYHLYLYATPLLLPSSQNPLYVPPLTTDVDEDEYVYYTHMCKVTSVVTL